MSSLEYTFTKMLGYPLGNVMHYACNPSKTKCCYVAGFDSVYGCGDGLLFVC